MLFASRLLCTAMAKITQEMGFSRTIWQHLLALMYSCECKDAIYTSMKDQIITASRDMHKKVLAGELFNGYFRLALKICKQRDLVGD